MFLVNEQAGDGTGSGVAVLVRAPDRKIDVPVVQLEFNVRIRMRQIPSHDDAARLSMASDRLDLEQLSAVVLNTRQQQQGRIRSVLVDDRQDLGSGNDVLPFVGADEHHRLVGVASMPLDLRFNSVLSISVSVVKFCEINDWPT